MRRLLFMTPGSVATLFVDLQEEHRHDPRFLADGYEAVLANAARLQSAARGAGVPVLHCAFVVDMAGGEHQPFHPIGSDGKSAFSDSGDPLTALCPEVAPAEGETVIMKAEASGFSRGVLDDALNANRPEWLVVCGVWTEACVYETVKDAQRRGYRVLLVKDACGSGTQAMHRTAILNLANRLYGGAVVDTETACRLMAGDTVEAWQVEGAVPMRYTLETVDALYEAL